MPNHTTQVSVVGCLIAKHPFQKSRFQKHKMQGTNPAVIVINQTYHFMPSTNFTFYNLTPEVRQHMLIEIQEDIDANQLYKSERLNPFGKNKYPQALLNAASSGTEQDFIKSLPLSTCFNSKEIVKGVSKKMASNAATLLCQMEFNHYYMRGVCIEAISHSEEYVEIYRARHSSVPRPNSDMLIGTNLLAATLLDELRKSAGMQPSVFPDINSGLSIKF